MACRPGLLPRSVQPRLFLRPCPFCSLFPARPRYRSGSRRSYGPLGRRMSSLSNPRAELERALFELQRRFPYLVNLPRLQLALQGLRKSAGDEVIRIAVLGLGHGDDGSRAAAAETAKRLLGTLLADPLTDEAPWEKELENHEADKPLVVRVGPDDRHRVHLRVSSDTAPRELHVSSPALNGLDLEFLLMPIVAPRRRLISPAELEEAVLVPVVGHDPSSVTPTPVHQALLVSNGLAGAVSVSVLPLTETGGAVKAAVDMPGVAEDQRLDAPSVTVVDTSLGSEAVGLFRRGPQNAMQYERLWYASNLPTLMAWLRASAETEAADTTKPAVRHLVASLLQRAASSIRTQDAACHSSKTTARPSLDELNNCLALWSQDAHAQLRDELDLAFAGRRWRQLGWWKLFWRVDDVAMLTNEMLSQRFLPTAERQLVYLCGRIAQTRNSHLPPYPQPASSAKEASPGSQNLEWPRHIAFTRRYLQHETVPALQALAQRLVMESLGTCGVTTSLAALLYLSSLASTLYEAGAVAALGVVYSLGRLQKKWDAARVFWEGEVREEGRKAVRGAQESVGAVLRGRGPDPKEMEAIDEARQLVATAEHALSRMT
ncbi:hypothetical protein XA68_16115 [Ophiocordyceps unilateralis]|uniref:Mmc1 C-terminal domain-containing protein n=1 Tax=Ophiocordyceps unilateralis TaxID=268505 RepID=A0A2A9P6U7_OPHUN|nr:hypothetical protein XA68_16115 [Ophiocordyceps unilateralis]